MQKSGMQNKEYKYFQHINIEPNFELYQLYASNLSIFSGLMRKDSEQHSTHIGYLTCIKQPVTDIARRHWHIIVEINKKFKKESKQLSLESITNALLKHDIIKEPIWIELRVFESTEYKIVGALWNND
jgi:hypothetical protein